MQTARAPLGGTRFAWSNGHVSVSAALRRTEMLRQTPTARTLFMGGQDARPSSVVKKNADLVHLNTW